MGAFLNSIFTGSSPGLTKDQNQLGDLAGYSSGIGKEGTTADMNYNLGILSGDPSKVAETLSPEIKQAQDQVQQNKNTVAQFGNRGGGMNAVMAGLDDATRAKLISLAGGLRQGAAANAGALGTANLGLSAGDTMDQAKLAEQQLQNFLNSILGKGISSGVASLEKWGLNKLTGGGGGSGGSGGGGGTDVSGNAAGADGG